MFPGQTGTEVPHKERYSHAHAGDWEVCGTATLQSAVIWSIALLKPNSGQSAWPAARKLKAVVSAGVAGCSRRTLAPAPTWYTSQLPSAGSRSTYEYARAQESASYRTLYCQPNTSRDATVVRGHGARDRLEVMCGVGSRAALGRILHLGRMREMRFDDGLFGVQSIWACDSTAARGDS